VASGSQAGYRVKETLFGQDNTAAGRTSSVTGQVTITGTQVTAASLTADLTSVRSDQSRRDSQFQGRIMDTAEFPTATFALTSPLDLGIVPADGTTITAKVTGNLTLRATTRSVTFTVTAKRSGTSIQVSGQIPVTFSDFNIPNPSFGPVTTQDNGILEFLVVLSHG
jgi:polyisoprenoid-binding protein YceI